MSNEQKRKNRPAGVNDKFNMGYTYFASNKEKSQLKTGEGHNFDNNELLKALGFTEKNGVMTLNASSNTVEKNEKGKVTKRTSEGRVLTGSRQAEREEDR